jgi:hypothetical protein
MMEFLIAPIQSKSHTLKYGGTTMRANESEKHFTINKI